MKIIAEIGSNWQSLEDCLYSVNRAKACGADIVKFQLFSPEDLYGPNAGYMIDLMNYAMNPLWLASIKLECDAVGIEFMCTGFSVEKYKAINDLVLRHKVASSELTDFQMLDYLNTCGKEVLLSVAGANMADEIRHALLHLRDVPVVLMHCVGDYPAKCSNLAWYKKMREHFGEGYKYGMSDHMLSVQKMATEGIEYYEKHVTFISAETPDQSHSLNEQEFKYFCQGGSESDLCNRDMNRLYRRRIIALRDIDEGETLTLGHNIGIFRPIAASTTHVNPFARHAYNGKKTNKFLSVGDTVLMSDISDK